MSAFDACSVSAVASIESRGGSRFSDINCAPKFPRGAELLMHAAFTADDAGLSLLREPEQGILSFLASRSKGSVRSLSPSAADVLNGCSEAIRQVLCAVLEARTQADFERIFQAEFPKYVSLIMATSNFVRVVVPKSLLERLTRESICEMEADFRDKGLNVFGASVRDQVLFTVWTLRKINELVTQIVAIKPDESKQKEDREYCVKFNRDMFLAQFSLDCLNAALETGQAVYPAVMEELADCLRAMVNAYTWARRGLEARAPSTEMDLAITPLDDEDRSLMDASLAEAADVLSND